MATASSPTHLPARLPGSSPVAASDLSSAQLRDFYAVLRLACQALPQVEESEAATVAQGLGEQLTQLIELQTLEASRIGGLAGADAEMHARFLKAALADELLLTADWAGRLHWRQAMLESRLFRTHHAGEKVYAQIDGLLAQRDPAQRPVARLYLGVLSLGFQGRYRDSGSLERIASYRRELFQFIFQRAPELQGRDRTLSPAAYASTLSHLQARRLPRLSRGWVQTLLALLGLLLISQVLWLWQSWPVREALDAVTYLSTGGPLC
jgi:type VI secretion system protein ImpK